MTLVASYISERDDLLASIDSTLSGVENRDLSDIETRSIGDARQRVETLNAQIALIEGAQGLTRAQNRAATPQVAETRSLGEQFTASDAYRNYGFAGSSGRFTAETRALPHKLADFSGIARPTQQFDVTPPTATPLLDAMRSIEVSTNAIETVVWTKKAGGANKVAEGAAKPSAEFGPTVTAFTLDTIAAFTTMTRQMIEDEPAVRDIINQYLSRDVALKMEAEAAAALAAASFSPVTSTASLLAAIRLGMGTLQAKLYTPNVVLLHPADWAALDIDVFNGSVASGAAIQRQFWNLTPIAVPSQTQGTALVADLGQAVQHYRRTGVQLYVTDSNGTDFVNNIFTVLAESRTKTIVTRPDAAVKCSKV